jgi:agmatine deiminase
LRILELPLPDPVIFEGKALAAGYANFVIAHGLVVVPTYNCPADRQAMEKIQSAFPNRRVIGLDARYLLRGGGAFHCVTQQQPEWNSA